MEHSAKSEHILAKLNKEVWSKNGISFDDFSAFPIILQCGESEVKAVVDWDNERIEFFLKLND